MNNTCVAEFLAKWEGAPVDASDTSRVVNEMMRG